MQFRETHSSVLRKADLSPYQGNIKETEVELPLLPLWWTHSSRDGRVVIKKLRGKADVEVGNGAGS